MVEEELDRALLHSDQGSQVRSSKLDYVEVFYEAANQVSENAVLQAKMKAEVQGCLKLF